MKKRVYLFSNAGKDFAKLHEEIREFYGDVDLITLVPAGYAASVEELASAEIRHLKGRGPLLLLNVLRLRKEHPDFFLVFFESIKLRIFASLAGARQVVWWRGKDYSQDLPSTLPATLVDLARARSYGLWTLARMYGSIYLRRFPHKKS